MRRGTQIGLVTSGSKRWPVVVFDFTRGAGEGGGYD
jgi:hypothetical protein